MSVVGEHLDPLGEVGDHRRPLGVTEVPGTERLGQDPAHLARCVACPDGQVDDELVTATENVGNARLVRRLVEAAVGSPAISHHDAGELRRDHLARLVKAAAVRYPVGGRASRGGDPEPGALATDAPTCLVGHDHG